MGFTTVTFILVLGILVFFHEFGHFIAARLLGVGVEVFSLGFGPRLVGKKSGMTDYRISALPLGGYVKMVGEDPDGEEEEEVDEAVSFSHKPVWRRMIIVAAGPLFNLVLSVLIIFLVCIISGVDERIPVISQVLENSPAESAGLLAGDDIKTISGAPIETWDDVIAGVAASQGQPIEFQVMRDGEAIEITATPKSVELKNLFGEPITRYQVGITYSLRHYRPGPLEAAGLSIAQTGAWCALTVQVIYKMFAGVVSPKTLGGPIEIARQTGRHARSGLLNLAIFIALLSVNLGIINLFPIPILDGGHLLFFAIEGLRRKPLSLRTREIAMQFGMALLLVFMVYVFYNDIARLITGQTWGAGG